MFPSTLFLQVQKSDLISKIMRGQISGQYDDDVKDFSIQLKYKSTSAYCFVRQELNFKLPSLSTIRSWTSINDGSPGITSQNKLLIAKVVSEHMNEGITLRFALSMDEMEIKSGTEYVYYSKKVYGYTNFGNNENDINNEPEVAKRTLFLC